MAGKKIQKGKEAGRREEEGSQSAESLGKHGGKEEIEATPKAPNEVTLFFLLSNFFFRNWNYFFITGQFPEVQGCPRKMDEFQSGKSACKLRKYRGKR